MTRLNAARGVVKRREGAGYDAWVLKQAGVGTMLANRVAMGAGAGAGLGPPKFLWVPYADALLFPLENGGLAAGSPDKKLFFPMEDRLRGRYLQGVGLGADAGDAG